MIKRIESLFNERKPSSVIKYRESAVMILLYEEQGEEFIIFEVRSYDLKNQPGDVCLPGGKVEKGEEPKKAAIREVIEELNVEEEDIEYIGPMDYFISPYGLILYPFVSKINKKINNPNKGEVDHIFKVPLKYFLENEPELYEMKIGPIDLKGFPFHLIHDGEEYKFRNGIMQEYFYHYNNHVIWGFTAHVIKSFIDVIKEKGEKFDK